MTSSIPSVIDQQTRWATSKGFETRNAYLGSVAANLRQELSSGALADFQRGDSRQLRNRGIKPPRMQALRSSAALSANVFDYWRSRDPYPLQYALHLRERITRVSFEENFPTGLAGNPPNVDVLLRLENNECIAIESRFTNWLTARDRSIEPRYLADGVQWWTLAGLPKCQALAESLREGGAFSHLDVPSLLKHALGLATRSGAFEIYYIYFDWDCAESAEHADELERFAELVGDEFRFSAMTYQELFARLASRARAEDAPYIEYLTGRYSQRDPLGTITVEEPA
jgi:hypothetical protein